MRRWLLPIFMALVFPGLFVGSAMADIKGSHHDMNAWLSGQQKDVCYECHGIKEAGVLSSEEQTYGRIGAFCLKRCHLNNGRAGSALTVYSRLPKVGVWQSTDNTLRAVNPPKTNANELKYRAHKFEKSALASMGDTGAPTGLPYAADTQFTSIQCSSCHNVHENQYAPFLQMPLADASDPTKDFCHQCHNGGTGATVNGRWTSDLTAAPAGSHPVSLALQTTVTRSGNNRGGRTLAFKDIDNTTGAAPSSVDNAAVFRNWSYSSKTDLNDPAKHYLPGGKLFDPATGNMGLTGDIGCYTCHATHIHPDYTMNNLQVADWKGRDSKTESEMCVGCHGATASVSNPGATQYYHPVGQEVRFVSGSAPQPIYRTSAKTETDTGVSFTFAVDVGTGTTTDRGVIYGSANPTIVCSSCHGRIGATGSQGPHAPSGATGMIIGTQKPTCASCHDPLTPGTTRDVGTTPNSHHAVGNLDYTAWGFPAMVKYSATDNATLNNGLSCTDCHIFSKPHNW